MVCFYHYYSCYQSDFKPEYAFSVHFRKQIWLNQSNRNIQLLRTMISFAQEKSSFEAEEKSTDFPAFMAR